MRIVTAVPRWTGLETKALRLAMRLTGRDFAGYLGVEPRTVAKWESRGVTLTLKLDSQALLDTALDRVSDSTRERFALNLLSDPAGEEDITRRREATKVLGLALTAAAASSAVPFELLASTQARQVDRQVVQGHQEVARALAGLYQSAEPRSALPLVASYADQLLPMLDAAGRESDQMELGTMAAGVHAQIGLWSCHMHQPAMAYRYLSTACHIAEGLADFALQARTLGAFSYLFSSAPRGGHGGDPHRAISLLDRALLLASRADGFTRGWLATWRADQHATLGNVETAQRDVELAEASLNSPRGDDGAGFFARPVYGYGMQAHCDSVRALTLALAGRDDEAARTFAGVHARAANARRRIATRGHQALAYVRCGQPEAASAELMEAAEQAREYHYGMGLERARGVRTAFDPAWSKLPSVRTLDEQLDDASRTGEGR